MPRLRSKASQNRRRKKSTTRHHVSRSQAWSDDYDELEPPLLLWGKRLIGIALIPACWILLETFLVLFRTDTLAGDYWKSREFAFFGLGSVLALVLFFLCRGPALRWLYVAGHELTHALFILICRGKIVGNPHISAQGGYVVSTRTNFLISLSPYFFPFYSVIVILLWTVTNWVLAENYRPDAIWLYGLLGLTWTFHLAFTFWMLRMEQSDITQNGRIFSFTIIFAVNLLVISAMLIMASPTASFGSFFTSFGRNTQTLLPRLRESLVEIYSMLPF